MVWDINKKIIRPNKDIIPFAGNASAGERTTFGTTSESDNLEENLNANYFRGWGINPDNTPPTVQDFAGSQFTVSLLNDYIYQCGIPEWDINQIYFKDSIAIYQGYLYISTTGDETQPNIGNSPLNTDSWALPEGGGISTLTIGSIQQSILTEEQFQAEAGPEWILWADNTEITGTALASILGIDTLPDASGRVFRNVGGNAAPLGEVQSEATAVNSLVANHSHSGDTFKGKRRRKLGAGSAAPYYNEVASSWQNGNSDLRHDIPVGGGNTTSSVSLVSSTDTETRMINITMNTFIKVN